MRSRDGGTFRRGKRGDYAQLKRALARRMLDAAECFVPGLADHVVFQTLATPLTNEHFLHATRGGIYGTEKTIGNLGAFGFPVRTPIRGLFQCGASTLAPGIHGVTPQGWPPPRRCFAARPTNCSRPRAIAEDLPSEHPEDWPNELRPRHRARPPADLEAVPSN